MIRRGFWLGLGAVLGIAGYRRLNRLAKALTWSSPDRRDDRRLGDQRAASIGAARQIGAGTASFVRDVRAGMADYMDASGEY